MKNNTTEKASADKIVGRSDPCDMQADSIPLRPDGRYLERAAIGCSWPHAAIEKRVPIAAVDHRSSETVGVGSGRARGCQSERKQLAA